MRIYISLPITGEKIEDVERRIDAARSFIEGRGHEAVSPLAVQPDRDAPYAELMGHCVAALLGCDAVVLLPGWGKSRGCRLEREAAVIYNKEVYPFVDCVPEAGDEATS